MIPKKVRRKMYASKHRAKQMLEQLIDKAYDKGWDAGFEEANAQDDFMQADYETLVGELQSVIDDLKSAVDRGDVREADRLLSFIGLESRQPVTPESARMFWVTPSK